MLRASVVVLILFCFSTVLPLQKVQAQSVERAGNSAEKARWQRLVNNLESIRKRQGAGAARRAYSDLTTADKALVRKGMRVTRIRASGWSDQQRESPTAAASKSDRRCIER